MVPAALEERADPGTTVSYEHTVTNGTSDPAVVNVGVRSSEGWPIRLYAGDATTVLGDTDGDGASDVGRLAPNESVKLVVEVDIPDLVAGGIRDVTTVKVSIAGLSKTATARDATTLNGKLVLTLAIPPQAGDSTTALDAGGQREPAISVDDGGGSVVVEVTSTGPWTGGCYAIPADGSNLSGAGPSLGWRVKGSEGAWTPFTGAVDSSCFSTQELGRLTYAFEYEPPEGGTTEPPDDHTTVTYRVAGDG